MLSLPALIVNIDPWPVEGREIDLDISADDLKKLVSNEDVAAPDIVGTLSGKLILHLVGRRLQVKGGFSVAAKMICDRCLGESECVLDSGEVDEVLDLIKPEDALIDKLDDDLGLKVVDGRVDLSPLLSELFWLAWPYRYICRDDCAGLCSQCGKDLNQGLCSCLKNNKTLN